MQFASVPAGWDDLDFDLLFRVVGILVGWRVPSARWPIGAARGILGSLVLGHLCLDTFAQAAGILIP